jgi:hypothetical protein
VLEILKTYLTDIEVVREPVETLFPVTDHRYDRLIETPAWLTAQPQIPYRGGGHAIHVTVTYQSKTEMSYPGVFIAPIQPSTWTPRVAESGTVRA